MLSSVLKSDKASQTKYCHHARFCRTAPLRAPLRRTGGKVLSHDKQLDDINEMLKWLGEENLASENWENRQRIGFKK